jgi:hypothetical protein|eukprot:SAG25_NODE_172_length_13022_cov_64.797500_12_plen_48_part_00
MMILILAGLMYRKRLLVVRWFPLSLCVCVSLRFRAVTAGWLHDDRSG